jgi:hypothetical protein
MALDYFLIKLILKFLDFTFTFLRFSPLCSQHILSELNDLYVFGCLYLSEHVQMIW